MTAIQRQFGINRLQYILVSDEIGKQSGRHHLHIQVILKKKQSKKTWFLDKITSNYFSCR